jgi:hypothetical protein
VYPAKCVTSQSHSKCNLEGGDGATFALVSAFVGLRRSLLVGDWFLGNHFEENFSFVFLMKDVMAGLKL